MRRWYLAALVSVAALAGCTADRDDVDAPESRAVAQQPREGSLTATPGGGGGGRCTPGEHPLDVGGGRKALMRVTAGGQDGTKALILVLHGAGSGGARGGLHAFRGGWNARGVVMVAPAAQGTTWSLLHGRDVDLPFVNRALERAFARCAVDRRRVAVGGFSDGATYALTLGLTNGRLFRAVMALSPGGVLAENAVGKPRVFIAHGTRDNVLPISRTSDAIVRTLRASGYSVTYRKFDGGHEARPEISRAAVRWFLRGP